MLKLMHVLAVLPIIMLGFLVFRSFPTPEVGKCYASRTQNPNSLKVLAVKEHTVYVQYEVSFVTLKGAMPTAFLKGYEPLICPEEFERE